MIKKCVLKKENKCQSKSSGGHQNGLLETVDNHCAKLTNRKELEFYRDVYKRKLPIIKIIPEYDGICDFNGQRRLLLKNVKKNFKNPCEIDIKLGKYTAYLQELLDNGDPLLHSLVKTFKMRLGNALTNEANYRVTGGNFMKNLSKKNIKLYDSDALIKKYLQDNKIIMTSVSRELNNIKNHLVETVKKTNLMLIGMSVYIIYDKEDFRTCKAYLIDFAHSEIVKNKHESERYCIDGLDNLISKINNYLEN